MLYRLTFSLLLLLLLSGCYTNKHQGTRDSQYDKMSFYPSFPNYNRDYTRVRFPKGDRGIYFPLVKKYSDKYYIGESLILAIMETESNFNPKAKSHIPAIGLMQIVPRSAGKDILGWKPTHNYLYDPENNIRVGTAYLNKVYYKYLKGINNPATKEYLTIAAYNTGVGNVLRSFSRDRNRAFSRINSMSTQAVYRHMLRRLPYKETRDYLRKVTARKKKYLKYDG